MPAAAKPDSPRFPFYILFLGLRYLRSRFSALAALLAVTFGVTVIVIALSIMGGYVDELRRLIRGQESHLIVTSPGAYSVTRVAQLEAILRADENVAATSPYVETLAMYRSAQFNPCSLRGILPEREALVTSLGWNVLRPAELDDVLAGSSPASSETEGGRSGAGRGQPAPEATRGIDAILNAPGRSPIGPDELAAFFQPAFRQELLRTRNPEVLEALGGKAPPAAIVGIHFLLENEMFLGQVVTVVTLAPGGADPVQKKLVVAGAFKSGDFDADSKWIYAHVDAVRSLLHLSDPQAGTNRHEGVRVALKDLSKLPETRERLVSALATEFPNLQVFSWEELPRGRNLLRAVDIEKFLIYFLLLLLVVFTCCMVLLMLLLTVIEKTRDMGILLALGATPRGVVRIFLGNGFLLSAGGIALGLAAGYTFCAFINPIHDWIHARTGWRLFPAEIYRMDRIPVSFRWGDILLSVAPPVILGFLASLAPAIWASRRDPIKAIHYE